MTILNFLWPCRGQNPEGARSRGTLALVDDLLRETYADILPGRALDPIYYRRYRNEDFDTGPISPEARTGLSAVRCPYCGTRATYERLSKSGLCEHCGGPFE